VKSINKWSFLLVTLVAFFSVVFVSKALAACTFSYSDCFQSCPEGQELSTTDCRYVAREAVAISSCFPTDVVELTTLNQEKAECSAPKQYECTDDSHTVVLVCSTNSSSFSVWGKTAEKWCSCDVVEDENGEEGGCEEGIIPNPINPNCEEGKDSLGYIISLLLPILPVVIGLILLAMIVTGGIKIATAGDNEEQKKKGIQTIVNAGIGVGVVVAAVIIISILEAILKVQILYGFAV